MIDRQQRQLFLDFRKGLPTLIDFLFERVPISAAGIRCDPALLRVDIGHGGERRQD
jgi:hypothetical protein